MKIIGIDPGTAIVGWAIIETGNQPQAIDYSSITTPSGTDMSSRLLTIHQALNRILKKYSPDVMSLEDLFFATNAKTAISVGQSRGVIMVTAALWGIPVVSYTPLTVKRTICGYGQADKKQIQYMIKTIFGLNTVPKPDDVADALAIALTHAFTYKLKGKISAIS